VDVESRGSVSTLGVAELFAMEKKWSGIINPMSSSGIETATFWLVA
jgi:hypothetical protein